MEKSGVIIEKDLPYLGPDREERLDLYCPAPGRFTGRLPGIVVIQEWWGLNDQIKRVADRFAQAGSIKGYSFSWHRFSGDVGRASIHRVLFDPEFPMTLLRFAF